MLNGGGTFEIDFDFVDHLLCIATSEGQKRQLRLEPMTVASFYARLMAALDEVGVKVAINTMPSEIESPIAFTEDTKHRSYDPDAAARFWRALVDTCRVFSRFRSGFLGKVSPIHLFWGGFDLAMTRFSGREAPLHSAVPSLPLHVVREAYSHEVSSAGFWPGGGGSDALFYSYAYPERDGFGQMPVQPAAAFYSPDLHAFLLPYEAARPTASPDDTLISFL